MRGSDNSYPSQSGRGTSPVKSETSASYVFRVSLNMKPHRGNLNVIVHQVILMIWIHVIKFVFESIIPRVAIIFLLEEVKLVQLILLCEVSLVRERQLFRGGQSGSLSF